MENFLKKWVFVWCLVCLASLTFSIALMEISIVAAVAGWLFLKFKRPAPLPFERKMFVVLCVFVFLSVLSIFWSDFPKQSFRGVLKVLKQFALFWVVAETLATPARHRLAWRVLLGVLLFLGIDGIWQYGTGADFLRQIPVEPASSGPRISASFKNYGLLAAFLILFVPVIFWRLLTPGQWPVKILAGMAGFLGLLLIFWTRARGAWVAFWLGLAFFLSFEKKKILLLCLIIATLGGLFALPRSMVIHLDSKGKEQSLIERVYLWDRAVEVIRARPLTGTGINTYAVAHQAFDRRQNWRVRNYYAHNGYLQMAAETGLPSLAFFLAFLFFYFRNALVLVRDSRVEEEGRRTLAGILTGLGNFMIYGLIDTIFHNPYSVMAFWFLAGWGVAYQRILTTQLPSRRTKKTGVPEPSLLPPEKNGGL